MGSLGIAIDGGRFVRIDSSPGGLYRTVRLRTLKAGQNSAKLDFCSFGKSGLTVRKSVVLEGLAQNSELPSELRLRVERRRYALWYISARKPDGTSEDIRVRTGVGLWLPISVALLILLLGLWLLLRINSAAGRPPAYTSGGNSAAAVSEAAETEAVESEAAAPGPDESGSDESPTAKPGDTPGNRPADSQELQPADLAAVSTTESPGIGSEGETAAEAVEKSIPEFPRKTILSFRPESAVLTSAVIAELDRLAEIMPGNTGLEIAGHCAIFGTERGRDALSRARAAAVADYLADRIPSSVRVEVRGYGGTQPLTRDMNLQDLNRRVEIIVTGEDS